MHVDVAHAEKGRRHWLGVLIALWGCPAAVFADGAAVHPSTYSFNLPAQSLGESLREVGQQTSTNILFDPQIVLNKVASAVRARLTVSQVITRLLKGTSLGARQYTADTILVRPLSEIQSKAAPGTGATPRKAGAPSSGAADDPPISSSEPGTSVSLQEVIVTAQKYQQRAFDVPISMSAIGGRDVERLKITNLEDLQFYVPGLQVDDDGTSLVITIRGISNLGGIQALVGTYLDEADLTSNSSFGLDPDTYDLARVEVLKGPQGTLYGEGSLGGTIRYVTNKPVLNEVEMGADVTALFDQHGAPENRVEAVVNAPVIANVFALRIAADLDNGGGWVDQPAANLKNINGKSLAAVRLQGRWQPRTDLTVDAMEVIHRESSGRYTGENPIGSFTQVFNLTTTPKLKNDYSISNLTVNWYPGSVTVVNSATYFTHYNNETEFGALYQFTPPPSPASETYEPVSPATQESLSDELRVSDNGVGRWRWMLGGLYKRIDFDSLPALYYSGVPGPPGSPLPVPYSAFASINSDSGSLFGDTNYRVLDRLIVGAGVRYFRDEENALLVGDAAREEGTFTSIDPRFYVRYGVSEKVNVYASAAKGFRSGGFNGLGYPPYQPEHVWTYDLGSKMRLLDGRMNMDGDVFLSDYAGYQIFGVAPPPAIQLSISSNAGNARVKGVEGNVVWMPTGRWQLSVSGDYLHARFVHISVLDSPYNVGDPLDYTPRYQVTTAAEREFRWLGRTGFARVDYTQRARTTYRNRTFGPWYYSQSDYLYLLGFHTGINWTSNLKLGFFVQNLLNDRGYTGPDVIESNSPREQPRTFGLDFSATLQ